MSRIEFYWFDSAVLFCQWYWHPTTTFIITSVEFYFLITLALTWTNKQTEKKLFSFFCVVKSQNSPIRCTLNRDFPCESQFVGIYTKFFSSRLVHSRFSVWILDFKCVFRGRFPSTDAIYSLATSRKFFSLRLCSPEISRTLSVSPNCNKKNQRNRTKANILKLKSRKKIISLWSGSSGWVS